jgi:predicted transposase YbfD/YdcC
MRRVLARIDADALDRAIGAWLARQQPPPANPPPPIPRPWRQAVAVDGKTLRGSGHHQRPKVHLLAVMDHTSRAVLAQTQVDAKTNEIPGFQPLLDGLDLAGRVVTADALHAQREHADWLVTHQHAAYILIVKANQPTLHHQLSTLPWREVPVADRTCDRGYGRAEIRRLQVTTVAGLDFPHATQAIRITRRARPLAGHKWRTVTVYAVTNLTAAQAHPARLADWIGGHWGIEALHHIRDTTYAEDASQVRTGTVPRAMARPHIPLERQGRVTRFLASNEAAALPHEGGLMLSENPCGSPAGTRLPARTGCPGSARRATPVMPTPMGFLPRMHRSFRQHGP